MFLQIIGGLMFSIGMYFVLADKMQVPFYLTSKAVGSLAKRQKEKTSGIDVWLHSVEDWLSKIVKLNEYKRIQLKSDLRTANMDVTPEQYTANAIIKAGIVGILAIPALFIFPIASPFIVIASIVLYNSEIKSVSKRIKKKREKIDYELPRLVFTIEKTLKHSRDVLYMLESYMENAGEEIKHELTVTTADMRSGNYEAAITRMESRVGSAMMSDVCRGLIGILRGDDTAVYWASLAVKFSDIQRQQLRAQAQKIPKKVNKLSICLLVCFVLVYVVVIISEIMSSLSVLFM